MCRHVAYLGPPITLDALLLQREHSLIELGQAPRHQTTGETNPDGYGIGWYDDRGDAQVHRCAEAIWLDTELSTLARSVSTTAAMAAVRLASPGSPVELSSTAPYDDSRWQFSLNGIVRGYHKGVGDKLRQRVSPDRLSTIRGTADTGVLFALTLDRLDAGASPAEALVAVVDEVERITTGTLNLLLIDGARMAATACGNSLFVDDRAGVTIASEPLDDASDWTPINERTLVEADLDSWTTTSL